MTQIPNSVLDVFSFFLMLHDRLLGFQDVFQGLRVPRVKEALLRLGNAHDGVHVVLDHVPHGIQMN